MQETKNIIDKIINDIEKPGEENLSIDDVMKHLLGRKSEYTAVPAEMSEKSVKSSLIDLSGFGTFTNRAQAEVEAQLAVANKESVWNIKFNRPFDNPKGPLGAVKGFIKRAVRKFTRPVVFPSVQAQNNFNAVTVRTLNGLINCSRTSTAEINKLNRVTAAQLQNLNDSVLKDRNDLQTIQVELNNRLNEISEQLSSLHGSAESEKNCLENVLSELTASVEGVISENNSLKAEISKLTASVEGVISENNSLKAEISKLTASVEGAISENNSLKNECAELRTEMSRIASLTNTENVYEVIDYEKFEKHFRGSAEDIKNRQREYLPYVLGKKKVIDLGCGRGEFLEICREKGISATGVDLYSKYVNECKLKGLDVHCVDALDYLGLLEDSSVDGIVAFQLAEHLATAKLAEMCGLLYKKVICGGTVILETPNPLCLSIYTNAFYIDPTHEKPVHPQTLKFFLENAGFSDVKILFTESSRIGYSLPLLDASNVANLNQFNDGINCISNLIWGSQDYAVIATK